MAVLQTKLPEGFYHKIWGYIGYQYGNELSLFINILIKVNPKYLPFINPVWEQFFNPSQNMAVVIVVNRGVWVAAAGVNISCGHDTDQTPWRINTKFTGYVYHHGLIRWLDFGANPQIIAMANRFSVFVYLEVCGCDTDQTPRQIYAKFSGYGHHHGTMRWLDFGPNSQKIVAVAIVFLYIFFYFALCGYDTNLFTLSLHYWHYLRAGVPAFRGWLFSFDGPRLQNDLPNDIRTDPSMSTFRKKKSKTYSFSKAFPP